MTRRAAGDARSVLLLALVVLVSRLVLLYRHAAGEPDVVVMAAGMIRHLTGSSSLSESILYGRQNGPGTYILLLPILSHVLPRPGMLLDALNVVGAVCCAALVWPVHRLFRMTLGAGPAAAGVLLAFLSPVMWEAGTYYHPIWPALLLWTTASLLVAEMLRRDRVTPGRAMLACGLAATAFVFRTEVVLTLPGLLWCAALMRPRAAHWGVIAACLLVTTAAYLVVESALTPQGGVAQSLATYTANFVESFLRAGTIGRNAVYCALSVGVATLLAVTAAPLRGRRERRARAAFLLVVPALALWLPNAVPVQRHFLTIAPIAAWLASRLWLDRLTPPRAIACAALVVAANVAIPEMAYRTIARGKTPHGAVFALHDRVEQSAGRFHALARHVAEPRTCAQVGWEPYGYVLYDLAAQGMQVGTPAVHVLSNGMVERSYPTAHGDTLRLLVAEPQSWRANPAAFDEALSRCGANARRVWVPREAVEDGAVPPAIARVATY